jgi:hypothetical protein
MPASVAAAVEGVHRYRSKAAHAGSPARPLAEDRWGAGSGVSVRSRAARPVAPSRRDKAVRRWLSVQLPRAAGRAKYAAGLRHFTTAVRPGARRWRRRGAGAGPGWRGRAGSGAGGAVHWWLEPGGGAARPGWLLGPALSSTLVLPRSSPDARHLVGAASTSRTTPPVTEQGLPGRRAAPLVSDGDLGRDVSHRLERGSLAVGWSRPQLFIIGTTIRAIAGFLARVAIRCCPGSWTSSSRSRSC